MNTVWRTMTMGGTMRTAMRPQCTRALLTALAIVAGAAVGVSAGNADAAEARDSDSSALMRLAEAQPVLRVAASNRHSAIRGAGRKVSPGMCLEPSWG